MSNTSPTPRPWTVVVNPYGDHIIGNLATLKTVAIVRKLSENSEANAAHIVRCVNSHDALIDAAKCLERVWENDGDVLAMSDAMRALSIAIEQAEGE